MARFASLFTPALKKIIFIQHSPTSQFGNFPWSFHGSRSASLPGTERCKRMFCLMSHGFFSFVKLTDFVDGGSLESKFRGKKTFGSFFPKRSFSQGSMILSSRSTGRSFLELQRECVQECIICTRFQEQKLVVGFSFFFFFFAVCRKDCCTAILLLAIFCSRRLWSLWLLTLACPKRCVSFQFCRLNVFKKTKPNQTKPKQRSTSFIRLELTMQCERLSFSEVLTSGWPQNRFR
jgi:hypothetical protein